MVQAETGPIDLLSEVLGRNEKLNTNSGSQATTAAPPSEAIAEHLQDSAQSVLSKMCGIEIEASPVSQTEFPLERHGLSGIIGVSGSIRMTLVINLSEEFALSAAEAFLGSRPKEIDADVIDCVGELANMIGGNTKERMSDPGLSLGLPTVVVGEGHDVSFGANMQVQRFCFFGECGELNLEVGLGE